YPNLNMEWLLTGKGKMYKNVSDSPAASEIFFAPEEPEMPEIPGQPDLFEDDDDLPLSDEEQAINSVEPKVAQGYSPSAQTSSSIATRIQAVQSPVNQRKVLKVTILFDDGTYQEL
ncbi:MAG: hypothetical protein MJY56_07510, partial [Bacteroidales bacterium]|nr:hypothetical protein [Bacteroidales bacterium]